MRVRGSQQLWVGWRSRAWVCQRGWPGGVLINQREHHGTGHRQRPRPHTALAWRVLQLQLQDRVTGQKRLQRVDKAMQLCAVERRGLTTVLQVLL